MVKNKTIFKSNQFDIDLFFLLKIIRKGIRTFLLISLAFALLGVVLAFSMKKKWTSEAKFFLNVDQTTSLSGSLSGLAGIAGVKLPDTESSSSFNSDYLDDVILSNPFLYSMLNEEFFFESHSVRMTLMEYLRLESKGWLSFGFIFPSRGFKNNYDSLYDQNLLAYTQEEYDMMGELKSALSLKVDKISGLVTINLELSDRVASAEILQFTIDYIQDYIKEYQRNFFEIRIRYLNDELVEKEAEYRDVQSRLAEYLDKNLQLATSKATFEVENLRYERDLKFNIWSVLEQKVIDLNLKLEQEKIVLTVLEPVSIPVKKTKPKRLMIIVVFGILGSALSMALLIWKEKRL